MNTDYFIINLSSLFMQILGQVTMVVTYGIGDLYTFNSNFAHEIHITSYITGKLFNNYLIISSKELLIKKFQVQGCFNLIIMASQNLGTVKERITVLST